eukprot:1156184-Pelagomonas_calceolata.AAC.24
MGSSWPCLGRRLPVQWQWVWLLANLARVSRFTRLTTIEQAYESTCEAAREASPVLWLDPDVALPDQAHLYSKGVCLGRRSGLRSSTATTVTTLLVHVGAAAHTSEPLALEVRELAALWQSYADNAEGPAMTRLRVSLAGKISPTDINVLIAVARANIQHLMHTGYDHSDLMVIFFFNIQLLEDAGYELVLGVCRLAGPGARPCCIAALRLDMHDRHLLCQAPSAKKGGKGGEGKTTQTRVSGAMSKIVHSGCNVMKQDSNCTTFFCLRTS